MRLGNFKLVILGEIHAAGNINGSGLIFDDRRVGHRLARTPKLEH
jgi:hypothetical protein